MTVKEDILEELRRGTPFAEIRRKFRSQSQLYEALGEYLAEADKIVGEANERRERAEGKLVESEARLRRVQSEEKQLSRKVDELAKAHEKLNKQVQSKTEKLDRVKADLVGLEAKGFTSEILAKINAIEDRSGQELLSQVETAEKYVHLKKEVSSIKSEKATLVGKIQGLETKKKKLEEEVVSEQNKLDELRLRTATVREAVAVVLSFFRAGYSSQALKSLKAGLDMLGIKGDPLLSIKRLVDGLLKYKNLVALEGERQARRKELQTLKKAIIDVKSELKVGRQLVKAFEEVKDAGVDAIAGVAAHTKAKLADVAEVSEKHMAASAGTFDAYIQRTMEKVRAGLGEWGELQEQKGRLREILHPAHVLLGILKSPEYLQQLPLTIVFQLFERLHLWSQMNLKDVTIKPSQDIWKKENNLNPWNSYRLPVLIEFVCEGLREIMIRQSRKE